MAINEKLFQMLMAKNPTTPFAMEESFPFSSLYGNATPLGPIIEMGFPDESNPLTADRAAQSVDYWRTAADQLLSDPATPDGSDPRKAYSKLVSSQAGILADHQFTDEAEQAFRIASQLYPASPEVTFRYVNLLTSQNRLADALQVAENALKADPANQQFLDLRNRLSASKARP
jgi:predicted Zn-dependent protease